MSVNRSMLTRIPIDVTRIIAALLVNNRPLLDVVRTYASIGLLGANVRSTRGHDGESRVRPPCTSLVAPPEPHPAHKHTQHPTPFPDGINSVKAKCYAIASAKVGSGIKRRRSTHTTSRAPCCSATRTAIIPAQLRQVFTVPNDARITVTETKTTYRLKEEHLVGLDEGVEDQSVRQRPGHAPVPEA
jgi:hypothetical protein